MSYNVLPSNVAIGKIEGGGRGFFKILFDTNDDEL
jgi:hypothetical protein